MLGEVGSVFAAVKRTLNPKPILRSANQSCLGTVFFDVPVYRLPQREYESHREDYVQQNLSDDSSFAENFSCGGPKKEEQWRSRFEEIYGGCWQFNEIIGFIRLFFYGTQIRGELWRVTAKKIVRTRTKVIALREPKVTYEEEIPFGSSDMQIFRLIMNYLKRAQNERFLRNRFIDTSVLEKIGTHVRWNLLLSFAQRVTSKAR